MAIKKAKRVTKKVTKRVAKKANIKATEKVNFTNSYNKIVKTAKNVNRQVMDTASNVAVEIMDNGEIIQKASSEKVKEVINKVAEVVTVKNIKAASKNIKQVTINVNEYTLNTAEELVEGALNNTEKWQAVTNKAIKGGLKLAAKQQNMIFDTLDTVKGQLVNNADRFKKIFSKN